MSTTAFSDAITHHENVVEAAKAAGVAHVHYTSIQHRPGSGVVISQVSDWEAYTVDALANSGLIVTLLRNSVYLDALPFMLGDDIFSEGIRVPANSAPAALVARGPGRGQCRHPHNQRSWRQGLRAAVFPTGYSTVW